MKASLIVLLFAASAFAQVPSAGPTSACGQPDISFKVSLNNNAQPLTPIPPGKARVYFIHDAGTSAVLGLPTTKIAMDGTWQGANHSNSYFAVSIDPGEHHVCATLQAFLRDDRIELAHFTAEAGKAYYFRTRLIRCGQVELLDLEPIDSDQGRFLTGVYPLSTSRSRK